jgi:hypothetical protein
VPAIYVRQLGDCVLCAAWRHRQSTLRHTGMSLRARHFITLCNWLLPGDAAQVAAVRFGFGNLCVCQLRRAERVVLYRSPNLWSGVHQACAERRLPHSSDPMRYVVSGARGQAMKAQASPLRAICYGPMSLRPARPTDRRA